MEGVAREKSSRRQRLCTSERP